MMLMTIPASSSSPPPLLSPSSSYTNPLLPVFTSTIAAAVLLPTSYATPTTTYSNFKSVKIEGRTTRGRRRRRRGVSSSDNQTVVEAPAATTSSSSAAVESPSLEVVRNFYGGINSHDLASVEDLIAHDCVYEDLIFSRPFVGRKAILEFFQKFIDSISMDLQFVIDDISHEDTSALGVTWHLEWKGKPFPFSKGCSFYRLEVVNGKRQIIYGRDCVEPAVKPGEMALVCNLSVASFINFCCDMHTYTLKLLAVLATIIGWRREIKALGRVWIMSWWRIRGRKAKVKVKVKIRSNKERELKFMSLVPLSFIFSRVNPCTNPSPRCSLRGHNGCGELLDMRCNFKFNSEVFLKVDNSVACMFA